MNPSNIFTSLPYSPPFLFVDTIDVIDENGVTGSYTFLKDSFYYKGHFKNNPITPGVILTECMAQIGLVCLGIYLMRDQINDDFAIAMSSTEIDFYKAVLPGEKVKVISKKTYFRFSKLKCEVAMFNMKDELICKGNIAGMIKTEI